MPAIVIGDSLISLVDPDTALVQTGSCNQYYRVFHGKVTACDGVGSLEPESSAWAHNLPRDVQSSLKRLLCQH